MAWRPAEKLWKERERDSLPEHEVIRAVDFARTAPAEQRDNAVPVRDQCAGLKAAILVFPSAPEGKPKTYACTPSV